MKITCAVFLWIAICSIAHAEIFGSSPNQFDVEFVPIGDPGNPADLTGIPRPAGRVDYVYEIAKYEISRAMVDAASVAGGLEMSLDPMDFISGGPRSEMPATGVSWNEAARFVNWLNSSQGYPQAYKFLAQPGDAGYHPNANIELWNETDLGYDAANPFRNTQARYALPSMDEWYKAAFYEPDPAEGQERYWTYPTGSNEPPVAVTSGTEPGTAVYLQPPNQGPADITQAGGLSPFGVMGMGGNVWEWEETELDLVNDTPFSIRGLRGGRWVNAPGDIWAFFRDDDDFPTFKFATAGFRIVSIPEPTSQLDFNVSPGVGRFQHIGDNLLMVEPIQDGYRVRVVQSAPQFGERTEFPIPDFGEEPARLTIDWPADDDQWYRFNAQVRSVSVSNEDLDAQDAIPQLESIHDIAFGLHVLPANPLIETYSFTWPYSPNHEFGDVNITWDFVAEPIDPPTPGDANADGLVNFDDFVALTNHFGQERAGWSGGDFNFDGTSDFDDFVILLGNFEATNSNVAAAIPEPSTMWLGILACGVFGCIRPKRRAPRPMR